MRGILCCLGLFLLILVSCDDDSTGPDPKSCPSGTVAWTNGHCYEAVLAPGLSWDQAQAACEARGGYLATVTSAEENAFVFSLVSGDSAFWYLDGYGNGLGPWLGGYQPDGSLGPDVDWRWVTDESFVYTNWENGQPGDMGGIDQNRLRFFKIGGLIGDRWDDCEPDNPIAHRLGYIFECD
jgi:hypothetical protein